MLAATHAFGVEQALAAILVVILVGLALFYGFRQVRALLLLRQGGTLAPDDRRYYRALAWRRLVSCVLMLTLAGLMTAYYLAQDARVRDLIQQGETVGAEGGKPAPTAEQRTTFRHLSLLWGVFVIVLLAWLCLAFFDVWAIRRFSVRHLRQIQADHRAAVENHVTKLRSERNGHG